MEIMQQKFNMKIMQQKFETVWYIHKHSLKPKPSIPNNVSIFFWYFFSILLYIHKRTLKPKPSNPNDVSILFW